MTRLRQIPVLARLKSLSKNLAIYGLGDVATSLLSLLLLPVYTQFLTPEDYGVIAMLLTLEAIAKIAFRWGVDTAFMRMYYDCADQAARQRLASTIFFFLLPANGTLVVAGILSAGWLSTHIFGASGRGLLIALVLANTFVAGFYFLPLQVMRISEQSTQYIRLVFARSAGTLLVRLLLVVGAGMGVLGVVVADVVVTAVFTPVLALWLRPLLRPTFSPQVARAALRFGLPRIPHSVANQVIGLADRYFLIAYSSLSEVGLYSIGVTFGLAPKLFLTAFESAWTPFFLGVMREPDAKRIYATVSTYALAVPVLLVATLAAVAPDLLRLTTPAEFLGASAVTPWIALGVMFQGVHLLGSLGLIITKRTTLYPIATGSAAVVSLLANVLLIPSHGAVGAAWANAIAYGALATITVGFSWSVYPIPYEWSRLLRLAVAGIVAYLVASRGIPTAWPPLAALVARSVATLATYLAVLAIPGFFHPGELRLVREMWDRFANRKAGRLADAGTVQVEMAGEIVSAGLEPSVEAEPPPATLVEPPPEPMPRDGGR